MFEVQLRKNTKIMDLEVESSSLSKHKIYMVTYNQLIKKKRIKKEKWKKVPALNGNPQQKGVCIKVITKSPKKPNSALRKIAYVRLFNRKKIYAYIPGEGPKMQEHSILLIRGGRVQDVPGLKYKVICGVYDFEGVALRKRARSKYGTRKYNYY